MCNVFLVPNFAKLNGGASCDVQTVCIPSLRRNKLIVVFNINLMDMMIKSWHVWRRLKKSFLAVVCFAFSAEAMADVYIDDIEYSIPDTDNKSVAVIESYKPMIASVQILDSVQIDGSWYKITSIGDDVFSETTKLSCVIAPYVTSVGERTFQYCHSLTYVSLGEVTEIGSDAFSVCDKLSVLELRQPDPEKIKFTGWNLDSDATLIVPSEEIATTYKNNNTWKSMFKDIIAKPKDGIIFTYTVLNDTEASVTSSVICGATDVVVPDSVRIEGKWYRVTSIGHGAIEGGWSLTSVSAPSVTSIGYAALAGCGNLTSVDFPNVTSIEGCAFKDCGMLTSVDFSNVTTIGGSAFAKCGNLASVKMPQVKEVPYGLFDENWNLRSVTLGEVSSIGEWAFSSCISLDTLKLYQLEPKNIKIQDMNAFYNVAMEKVTLIVPAGAKSDYESEYGALGAKIEENFDPDVTYVVVTDELGRRHIYQAKKNVKVEWQKGSDLEEY